MSAQGDLIEGMTEEAGDYSFRLAGPEDAPVVARQRAAMFEDMGEVDANGAAAIENHAADHIQSLIEAREYLGFLAERDGEVVAGAGLWLRPLLPRPGTLQGAIEGYVLNVYTERGHRRRGLARRLMLNIVEWCRGRGVARVVLHASPEGRPLYEDLGFNLSNEYRLKLD